MRFLARMNTPILFSCLALLLMAPVRAEEKAAPPLSRDELTYGVEAGAAWNINRGQSGGGGARMGVERRLKRRGTNEYEYGALEVSGKAQYREDENDEPEFSAVHTEIKGALGVKDYGPYLNPTRTEYYLKGVLDRDIALDRSWQVAGVAGIHAEAAARIGEHIYTRGHVATQGEAGRQRSGGFAGFFAQNRTLVGGGICGVLDSRARHKICLDAQGMVFLGLPQLGFGGGAGLTYEARISDQRRPTKTYFYTGPRGQFEVTADGTGPHTSFQGGVAVGIATD